MTDTALTFPVDIWLRAEENAATRSITGLTREPRDWVDDDVKAMLEGMLLEMHRLKYPEQEERPIALRSLSWIVNPYEEGGVVVAIEITLGAAIVGDHDELVVGSAEETVDRAGELCCGARPPTRS